VSELDQVLRRNIEALVELRRRADASRTRAQRTADRIARFVGSVRGLVAHAVVVAAWLLWNGGATPWLRPFDPFPFQGLATAASVEALLLTTFVLISQGQMAAVAERGAELDLQISLLAEHELTRLIQLADAIAERLGVEAPAALDDLERDVHPDEVLADIERARAPEQGPALH
jgi:uncharacterized membrane protein